MSDFQGYNPRTDPSRRQGGNIGFNNWLYTPMDRRPKPAVNSATSPGFHGPTSPVATGNYTTPFGTASVISGAQYRTAKEAAFGPGGSSYAGIPSAMATAAPIVPAYGGAPIAGSPGPSGPISTAGPSSTSPSQPSGQNGTGTMTGLTPTVQSTVDAPAPGRNSLQHWQEQAASETRGISPERRFFWATGGNKGGLIDASAPQADPSQNKGAIPDTSQQPHMDSRPVTPPAGGYSWEPKVQTLAPAGSWNTYTPY